MCSIMDRDNNFDKVCNLFHGVMMMSSRISISQIRSISVLLKALKSVSFCLQMYPNFVNSCTSYLNSHWTKV